MSYLLDFVKSFTEDELNQFRQLDLIGKVEMVRDAYATHGRQKEFDEQYLLEKLQLTKSHFDKINSLLLDKALTHFAGPVRKEKFEFLLKKQLNGLILHEVKLEEKKLKKQKDKPGLKQLYHEAFYTTVRFNYNNFPVKEIDSYCRLYIQLLGKQEEGERYKTLGKYEEALIRYYYPRKDGADKRDGCLKNLLKLEAEIKGKKLFEGEFGINLGISSYYETGDPEKGLYYLTLADEAAKHLNDKVTERDRAFLLAMAAQLLIDLGRFQEGIEKYRELFEKFPALASARVYHPFQYVFTLLIVKDFTGAAGILKKYIDPFLQNENARNFHFDVLRLYAIYHLLNHETEKAGVYLQQLMQFSKEDFTVLGDVLFRLVHNVYCAQTGDYPLAADVHKKNVKYIDSKLEIEGMAAYKKMFLDLGKVIRFKSKAGTQTKPFPENEIEPGEGRARLYQDLIKLPLQ